ncbi:MAG: ComEC/Rec2 family competence protein [Collinsella sp.]
MLSVTLCSQLATLPITIPAFGTFSLIAPLANAVIGPVVSLLLCCVYRAGSLFARGAVASLGTRCAHDCCPLCCSSEQLFAPCRCIRERAVR